MDKEPDFSSWRADRLHEIYYPIAEEVSNVFMKHELSNWDVKQVLEGMLKSLIEGAKEEGIHDE